MKELYKFFKNNGKLIDIQDYNPDILHIFSRRVLKMIASNTPGWEEMLPEGISEIIKKDRLFGFIKRKKVIK